MVNVAPPAPGGPLGRPVMSVPPPSAVHALAHVLRTIRAEDLQLSSKGARIWRGIQPRLATLLALRDVRARCGPER